MEPNQIKQKQLSLPVLLLCFLIATVIFNFFKKSETDPLVIMYSDFIEAVEKDQVAEVLIQEQNVYGRYKDGALFKTFAPSGADFVKKLENKKVKVAAKPREEAGWLMMLLVNWFPMLLLIGVWIFFMRQSPMGGGGKIFDLGKSKAKLLTPNDKTVTFENVAGIDEAKEELQEIIEFLKNPHKFTKLGGKIPKGVLLIGAPGTGKTLLARAVAGEAGVPFFSMSGSGFVEMFVGVGASRVRDLFVEGKKNAPCIIFIDELDAVGRHRGAGLGGGHDEREQTLNQLLVEMDGFETKEGVIIMAATNRPDVLDPALVRPGRFDRQVVVPRPDILGRKKILEVHTKNVPIDETVNLEVIARGTPGFAGAELENLVNEAALLAARQDKERVSQEDFEAAKDKVMMGAERKSAIISPEEKKITAYHEAGHALIAALTPGADPIHKVTIIPRGMSMGSTWQIPVEDVHTYPKDYLEGRLAILYGGRAAEAFKFGENKITTGAGNDIENATEVAEQMTTRWGMSKELGPIKYGNEHEHIFLGQTLAEGKRKYSEATAGVVDAEKKKFLDKAYAIAEKIIAENEKALEKLASALLEKETLNGAQVEAILKSVKPQNLTPNE